VFESFIQFEKTAIIFQTAVNQNRLLMKKPI